MKRTAEPAFTAEELATEEWRPVAGFEGVYSISDLGRVRRDKGGAGTRAGRILKPGRDTDGYSQVFLSGGSRTNKTLKKIHALVCLAFLGPRGYRMEVNHRNGIKADNRLSNLEWVTSSQNKRHAVDSGLWVAFAGEQHWKSKLTEHDVRVIRHRAANGERAADIAPAYGMTREGIRDIVQRKIWRHVA